MAIQTTSYKLPLAVIPNAVGVNVWENPNNALLKDDQFASSLQTSILELGNFNLNLPVGSTANSFSIRVTGYRGAFNTTLDIYAIDDTSGTPISHQYTPSFQGFNGTNTTYVLTPSLFATTWDTNQINNIKLRLIADGELHIDCVEISVTYNDNVTPVPPTPSTGETVCDEFVQAQPFTLAQSCTASDLYFFLSSFTYPNGVPIQYADFYSLNNDTAIVTIDQGTAREEDVNITSVEQNYNGTDLVRIGVSAITNRGLKLKYPYTHDINLCFPHDQSSEVVISNSAPFYNRFLKKCQIGALVSAPIVTKDEGTQIAPYTRSYNFVGDSVTATAVNNPGGGKDVTVTINAPSGTGQSAIQFKDEGTNLGSSGTVNELDFTGAGVTATRTGNKVTVDIPNSGGGGGTGGNGFIKNGIFTRDIGDVDTVQTIPHGLGYIPSKVTLNAVLSSFSGPSLNASSNGFYTTSPTISTASTSVASNAGGFLIPAISSNTNILDIYLNTGGTFTRQQATITVDATNIYLTWTRTDGGTLLTGRDIACSWEAEVGGNSVNQNFKLKYLVNSTTTINSFFQVSDVEFYWNETGSTTIKKYLNGVITTIGNATANVNGPIFVDSNKNIFYSILSNPANTEKMTPSGVVTTFYATTSGNSANPIGIDLNDNVYLTDSAQTFNQFVKVTPSGVPTTLSLGTGHRPVSVLSKSTTEHFVGSNEEPGNNTRVYTLNNSGVTAILSTTSSITGNTSLQQYKINSAGNLFFKVNASMYEVTYGNVLSFQTGIIPSSYFQTYNNIIYSGVGSFDWTTKTLTPNDITSFVFTSGGVSLSVTKPIFWSNIASFFQIV